MSGSDKVAVPYEAWGSEAMWVVVENYDPFLGTLYVRCRIITRIQKGTIILTTTHITPVYILLIK